ARSRRRRSRLLSRSTLARAAARRVDLRRPAGAGPLVLGRPSPWADGGHLAAALVALSPNVHAHVSLATTDVPLVLTFVATMIAVIVDLERPSWGSAALLAVVLGAALATKYSALSLFLAVTVLFVWHRHRPWWSSMLIGLGALTVTWGCHWWALSPVRAADSPLHGLPVPIFWRGIRFQMYLDGLGQMAFLLGDRSRFGWSWYFPFALLVKSSPVELVALASFVTTAAMRRGGGVEEIGRASCRERGWRGVAD